MSITELRAALHARIDALDEQQLAIVEKVLLRLQLDKISAELEAGFEADRRAGLLEPERVQAIIDQFRKEHPYR